LSTLFAFGVKRVNLESPSLLLAVERDVGEATTG
jgi:hypothetical protein